MKLFSHRGRREHRDIRTENGKEVNPAPVKQIPQVLAFSFCFLNLNSSVASVTSVANKFLIFLFSILFPSPLFFQVLDRPWMEGDILRGVFRSAIHILQAPLFCLGMNGIFCFLVVI